MFCAVFLLTLAQLFAAAECSEEIVFRWFAVTAAEPGFHTTTVSSSAVPGPGPGPGPGQGQGQERAVTRLQIAVFSLDGSSSHYARATISHRPDLQTLPRGVARILLSGFLRLSQSLFCTGRNNP